MADRVVDFPGDNSLRRYQGHVFELIGQDRHVLLRSEGTVWTDGTLRLVPHPLTGLPMMDDGALAIGRLYDANGAYVLSSGPRAKILSPGHVEAGSTDAKQLFDALKAEAMAAGYAIIDHVEVTDFQRVLGEDVPLPFALSILREMAPAMEEACRERNEANLLAMAGQGRPADLPEG